VLRCMWRNVAQSPFSWGEADVGGLKDFCVNFPCCNPELCIPGFRRGVRLEETDCGKSARWVWEGGEVSGSMVDLNALRRRNGG